MKLNLWAYIGIAMVAIGSYLLPDYKSWAGILFIAYGAALATFHMESRKKKKSE